MQQVATVEDGHAGKKFKAAGGQIKIIPDPAKARVGVETGKDRITIAAHARLPT
jgi:hypothetical protein